MKIKLIKSAIVGGKSKKVTGKPIEVPIKEAKILIATGKAVDPAPKEEASLTLAISPKDFEGVKTELEGKANKITELENVITEMGKQLEEKDKEIIDLQKSLSAKAN